MSPAALITMWIVLGLVVLLVIFTTGYRRDKQQSSYDIHERANMPAEIADGKLIHSERYFRTKKPCKLGARFDQVYLTPSGVLVPVDTKRRKHRTTYPYDQIELSVQAAVLRHGGRAVNHGRPVATYGYVRGVFKGCEPFYLQVSLLSNDDLVALDNRYRGIVAGKIEPKAPTHPGVCRSCPYRDRCPDALT